MFHQLYSKRLILLALCFLLVITTGMPQTFETPGQRFRSKYKYIDLGQFVEQMEADRRLLSEIRKEVPDVRQEAEMYLDRLKNLAARSDPIKLVPLVNRVMSQAPIYFEWLEREFEDQEEQVSEYYVGGARGFHFALENFKSAVMMTIINRLDMASRLFREMDPDTFQ